MILADMLTELARDPKISVEKMHATIDAVKHERQRLAVVAFNTAILNVQKELPEIDENGAITRDGKEIAKYSELKDIQRALKPILSANGLTLTFSNGFPAPNEIEVSAIVTHVDGHHAENAFRLPADDTMANTAHAMASSESYAKRRAVKGLFNIVDRSATDKLDENVAAFVRVPPPDGYMKAAKSIEKCAVKGQRVFARKIKKLSQEHFEYLVVHDAPFYRQIKLTATRADEAQS